MTIETSLELNGKTLLITGGAGFIGSWLVKTALRRFPETKIINVDALTYAGNLENLKEIESHPNYQFVLGNICDETLVNSLMQQVDYVIHSAAQTHVDRSIDSSYPFVETNVMGTQVLLEAALKNNIKKFVLVSTDEVYGSLTLESTERFTENTGLNPTNPYSASKAGGDLLALSYAKTHNFPLCITRCGNNYGPYQYPEKLIPFFLSRLIKGEDVPVYGDGKHVRDWIFVEDHAQAILTVLEKGETGGVYNISADDECDNLAIIKQLMMALNVEDPESHLRFVPDRPAHDRRYSLESSKIRTLGWQPKTHLQSGLEKTIQWYQENPEWIQNILQRQKNEQVPQAAQWLQKSL